MSMTTIATVTRTVTVAMVCNTSSTKIGQCGMTDEPFAPPMSQPNRDEAPIKDKIVYRAQPVDSAFIYLESWCIEICDYCPHRWKAKVGDTMHGAAHIIRITGLEIPAPRKPPMVSGLRKTGSIVDIKMSKDDERL
jgi:hypothetical protein